MREVMGILLAAMMVFSLAACGETESTTESAKTTKSVTVTPAPSESAEPSESPEPTESAGEPSEEPTEPSATVEPTEEEVDDSRTEESETTELTETINPPSEEVVHQMVDGLDECALSVSDYPDIEPLTVVLNTNQAAEFAAMAYFKSNGAEEGFDYDTNRYAYLLPESGLAETLKNLFGASYNLADYTNTVIDDIDTDSPWRYGSAFTSEYGFDSYVCLYNDNDQFYFYIRNAGDGPSIHDLDTNIISIEKNDLNGESYTVNIEYVHYDYIFDETTKTSSLGPFLKQPVQYELVPDESSVYGWIIAQITYEPRSLYMEWD